MAKVRTLKNKLKSAIKKWPTFPKRNLTIPSIDQVTEQVHQVYVGKSLRPYYVTTEVVKHPLFKELVDGFNDDGVMVIASEVILFEHLLWMLENGGEKLDAMDELVEFYTC